MNKDKISKLGYKKNSPYKNRESLTIGSNFITTEDMAFPILAMGDGGESQVLYPNTGSYLFPNSSTVQEYKLDFNKNTNTGMKNMMANGGMMNEYDILSSYLPTLSPEDQDTFIDSYQRSNPRQKQEILMKCGGMMKYQQGGSVPSNQPMPKGMQVPREMANAEVEGGETAMNPNGVLMQFNGPSHENGGIPTMLEGGTKVFSDHLKVPVGVQKELGIKRPNKKTTYADISKRFPTEKHMQTLADTEDKYKRNAAEIQLQKNLAMLETLFFAQEQDKMMKETSNPANMQMQQPMTVDGLQYAQYGDEINPRSDERFMKLDYSNLYYDPYRDRLVTRDDDSGVYSPARYSYSKPTSAQIQTHLERYPNKSYQLEQQKKLKGLKQQVDPFSKNNIIPYVQGPNADAVRAIVDPFNKRNTIPHVKRKEEETGSMEKLREQLDPFGKNNTITYVDTPQKSLRDLIDPFSPDNIIPYVDPNLPTPLPIPPDIIELPENRNTSSGGSKSTSSSKKVATSTSTSTTTTPSKSITALPPIPTPIASNPTKQPFNWLTYKPSYPAAQSKPVVEEEDTQEVEDAITKEKYPFGINPKLLGSAIDVAAVLSDRISVDSPALYNRQKNPMFNRFYEFDNLETQRLANQQIQSIMNSNMPEQVKQAQIAQITAQSQDQQARVDFANAQRYEQKREADLAKLQSYTDANLDTRIADYDNWRQRMARVKDMQNQFKSWRKQQLVGTLKDQLGYMEKLKSINELNPYFERSWLTGTDRYKPQGPNVLNMDPTQGYDKTSSRQTTLPGGATVTDMGDFYVIMGTDGVPKIQEKKSQKSSKMTLEQAASMYKFGGYKY